MISKHKTFLPLLILVSLTSPFSALADGGREFIVRPHFGIGHASSNDDAKEGDHTYAGLRLLLSANAWQRYGVEVTRIDIDADDGSDTRYVAAGIVLEQKPWRGFIMSIGTMGYFGDGDNSSNPVGLVTNLGWESTSQRNVKPFVTFRSDTIWDEPRTSLISLNLGLSFSL